MENDYIERKAALMQLSHNKRRGDEEWMLAVESDMEVIRTLPAADAVQVVRCKDCENWQTDWNPSIPDRHYCAVMDSIMKADDFCSHGERREK